MVLSHLVSKNSALRQQQQPVQQQQPNSQQQFQQQQQQIQSNTANTSSGELQGLVLQDTDRYAGLSGFDSIAPSATSVSAAQKQNQLTNPTTGIIGNANFDTNFNSINTNNFSNNSGIFAQELTQSSTLIKLTSINTVFMLSPILLALFDIERANLSLLSKVTGSLQ